MAFIPDNNLRTPRYEILETTPANLECTDSRFIYVWTDGGGYEDHGSIGVVVVDQGVVMMTFGEFLGRHITNNVAELEAIIKGLKLVKHLNRPVRIFSDSQYAISSLCDLYNGTKNLERIQSIQAYLDKYPHKISFIKVKGHTDLLYNDIADKIASNLLQSRPQGHKQSTSRKKKPA